MAEYVGGEPMAVGVGDPITFENKTDDSFSVNVGIVFRKSGLYRVTVDDKHTSVEIEPERKRGRWIKSINPGYSPFDNSGEYIRTCSECGFKQTISDKFNYCPMCGAKSITSDDVSKLVEKDMIIEVRNLGKRSCSEIIEDILEEGKITAEIVEGGDE